DFRRAREIALATTSEPPLPGVIQQVKRSPQKQLGPSNRLKYSSCRRWRRLAVKCMALTGCLREDGRGGRPGKALLAVAGPLSLPHAITSLGFFAHAPTRRGLDGKDDRTHSVPLPHGNRNGGQSDSIRFRTSRPRFRLLSAQGATAS